jgi:hypothetical protein
LQVLERVKFRAHTVLTHGPTASRGDQRTSNYTTNTLTLARDNLTTIDLIDKAIAAIESRELGEKLVYQHYANYFSVNVRTLARRH